MPAGRGSPRTRGTLHQGEQQALLLPSEEDKMVFIVLIRMGTKPIAKLIVDDLSYDDLCWDLAEVQAEGFTTEMAQAIPSGAYVTQLQ